LGDTIQPATIGDHEVIDEVLMQAPSDEVPADHASAMDRNQQKIMVQNVRSMKDVKFNNHQSAASSVHGKENSAFSSEKYGGPTVQFKVSEKDISSSRKRGQAGVIKKGHHATKSDASADLLKRNHRARPGGMS
jgi:hypothetical protein